MNLAWGPVAAGIAAWLCTRWLVRASPRRLQDRPNRRSLHQAPVPRSGGVAVVLAIGLGWIVAGLVPGTPLPWAGAALCAALGLGDDWRGLGVLPRLLGQGAAAGLALAATGVPELLSLPGMDAALPGMGILSLIFLLWMVNLYNFMDGMDGFAGGMGVVGFGSLALAGLWAGAADFAAAAAVVAAAAAGFLVFNRPPARIFLGDAGSTTLGLLAGSFGLWAEAADILPLWATVLIFAAFVVDASATLVRRLLHGEAVWVAHRKHVYQCLVRLGWGHRRTVHREYLVMLATAASALWAAGSPAPVQWAVLAGWGLFFAAVIAWTWSRCPWQES